MLAMICLIYIFANKKRPFISIQQCVVAQCFLRAYTIRKKCYWTNDLLQGCFVFVFFFN